MSDIEPDMSDIEEEVLGRLARLQRLLHRQQARRGRFAGRRGNPRRGQGRVLSALALKPQTSQRELMYLLDMSKQGLAELLGKLETDGLVTREPSEQDRRVLLVRLTEAGRAAAEELAVPDDPEAGFLDALTADELRTLNGFLARLIESLDDELSEYSPEPRPGRGPRGGHRGPRGAHGFPGEFGPYGGRWPEGEPEDEDGPGAEGGFDPDDEPGPGPRGRGGFPGGPHGRRRRHHHERG